MAALAIAMPVVIGAAACQSATVASPLMDVGALGTYCKAPGPCGRALACEGKTASVKGQVDFNNVFDRARFPSLPYEKFTLVDARGGRVVEVWAVSGDNGAIFRKLLRIEKQPAGLVQVRGTMVGFDMPMASGCTRDVRLELSSADDLQVQLTD